MTGHVWSFNQSKKRGNHAKMREFLFIYPIQTVLNTREELFVRSGLNNHIPYISSRIFVSSPGSAHNQIDCNLHTGTVKRHNVCKRHVSNDTGFKQTERAIFLHVISNWITIGTAFKCIFEETMRKLSVNFGNRSSQESHKNQYPGPVLNFGFTEPQYSDRC